MKYKKYRIFDDKLKKYYYFDLDNSFGMIPTDLKDNIEEFTGHYDMYGIPIYEGDTLLNTSYSAFKVEWDGLFILKPLDNISIPLNLHENAKYLTIYDNI